MSLEVFCHISLLCSSERRVGEERRCGRAILVGEVDREHDLVPAQPFDDKGEHVGIVHPARGMGASDMACLSGR